MTWQGIAEGLISGLGISLILGYIGHRAIISRLDRIERKIGGGSGPSR